MPAELSRATIKELDQLEPSEVMTVMLHYLATRHRLLAVGQTKLVAIFDNGYVRKALLELSMSPGTFDQLAGLA